MKRILLIKVTSLGDVVQAQPIVTDLHRAFPGVLIDWATDSAYAEIPGWNPGIAAVYSAPLRGFKSRPSLQGLRELARGIGGLRRQRYDAVIDIHGVYKSAIISRLARSRRRWGYAADHLGERGAAALYTDYFERPRELGAVQGMRVSVGQALGYTIEGAPAFNLRLPAGAHAGLPAEPAVIFFHATSRNEKKWAPDHWITVGCSLAARGYRIDLPWGSPTEEREALALAAHIPNARVMPPMSLTECARVIASAGLVVGVDTGLAHLACALGTPTVMIFAATPRDHYGIDLPGRAVSLGDPGAPPSVEQVIAAIDAVLPMSAAASA